MIQITDYSQRKKLVKVEEEPKNFFEMKFVSKQEEKRGHNHDYEYLAERRKKKAPTIRKEIDSKVHLLESQYGLILDDETQYNIYLCTLRPYYE